MRDSVSPKLHLHFLNYGTPLASQLQNTSNTNSGFKKALILLLIDESS